MSLQSFAKFARSFIRMLRWLKTKIKLYILKYFCYNKYMITIASSLLDSVESKLVEMLQGNAEIPANNKDQVLRDIVAIRVMFHKIRIDLGIK